MAKGRKRKVGPREPNGRISRAGRSQDVMAVALAHPHRACLPERLRVEQAAESVVGRAQLTQVITDPQYWAAIKYRRLVASFHAVMASPITRQSAAAIGVAASMEAPAEAEYLAAEPEDEAERWSRTIDAMNAASSALKAAGALCVREVNAVVLEDRAVGSVSRLRAGLDALVALWRLDGVAGPKRRAYWRSERPESMELVREA